MALRKAATKGVAKGPVTIKGAVTLAGYGAAEAEEAEAAAV